ncbi:MAG: amidohydrolase family protein [Acidobacteria bacterium]|nr:amidohydrolase family protein [Acidobacteriota bacterium]
MRSTCLAVCLVLLAAGAIAAARQGSTVAFVGATVIDGTGVAPIVDGVVVVDEGRIRAVGAQGAVSIPSGTQVVDAKGRWIVPGFIDTNVHLSLYGGVNERYETLVRYADRQRDIVLEAAQLQLLHGVTTVRDSYGLLEPLVAVRDEIAAGRALGPRILAAGNIVGWGGPYSVSFSLIPERGLTLFQEQMNDAVSQDAGEELTHLPLDELRRAIRAYLDKGPDFLKYGGTAHFARPSFIGFSPEAQRVIVDETHRRERLAETHATTPEGLRLSIEAGIDLIQHPEVLSDRELPDPIVRAIVERGIICSMLTNTMTGETWTKHLKDKGEAEKKRAADKAKMVTNRALTTAEQRQRDADLGVGLDIRRQNAKKLIEAGAIVTVGTDNYWAAAAELSRTPKLENQSHGIGTIIGIEGLVELGMTPMQALVAATANGARASKMADIGTIASGQRADLLLLAADPLTDIRNIRQLVTVMKDGRIIDRDRLPERRVLSPTPTAAPSTSGRPGG